MQPLQHRWLTQRGGFLGQCLAGVLLLCGALFSPSALAQVSANYVKLEALSEAAGNPWAAMAEFNVLDAAGAVIPRTGWIASADSANAAYSPASAIDGDSSTYWHTEWSPSSAPYPHWFVVNLGSTRVVGGFKYLPRPAASGTNGRIANWRFYTSTNGVNWTLLTTGAFANSASEQTVYPIKTVQYVKLEALSEVNGNPWASMAEFNLLDTAGAVIPRAGWTASADSANAAYSPASAIDGDSSTFWHTEWSHRLLHTRTGLSSTWAVPARCQDSPICHALWLGGLAAALPDGAFTPATTA